MLTTAKELQDAITTVTPVLLDWMSNVDYPYGDDILVDRYLDGTFTAVMILNEGISRTRMKNILDDDWTRLELLTEHSESGDFVYGNGNTPVEALFNAEMNLRKLRLKEMYGYIVEKTISVNELHQRYTPFKKLTETQFMQFLVSIELLMKHLDKKWYIYSDTHHADVTPLEALLTEAAALFRFYEEYHRSKMPVSNDVPHLCAKADRNADIASRIETALGIKHEIQQG